MKLPFQVILSFNFFLSHQNMREWDVQRYGKESSKQREQYKGEGSEYGMFKTQKEWMKTLKKEVGARLHKASIYYFI